MSEVEDIHLCMVVYRSTFGTGGITSTSQAVRLKTSEVQRLRET